MIEEGKPTPLPTHVQIISDLANIQPLALRQNPNVIAWGAVSSLTYTPSWVCTFCRNTCGAEVNHYGQPLAINPTHFTHDADCVWERAIAYMDAFWTK